MINFEKYGEEALDDLCHFVSKFNINVCSGSCNDCVKKAKEWLLEEYKKKTDWSKVPLDTPINVWDLDSDKYKGYFAGTTVDGSIMTYYDGKTRWSSDEQTSIWKNGELIRKEDIEKYCK